MAFVGWIDLVLITIREDRETQDYDYDEMFTDVQSLLNVLLAFFVFVFLFCL